MNFGGVYFEFAVDVNSPFVNLYNKSEEQLINIVEGDIRKIKKSEEKVLGGFNGEIINTLLTYGGQRYIGINCQFPFFNYKNAKPNPIDVGVINQIKDFIQERITGKSIKIVVAIHGHNDTYFSNTIVLFEYRILGEIISHITEGFSQIDCTLIACHARKFGIDMKLRDCILEKNPEKTVILTSYFDLVTLTKNKHMNEITLKKEANPSYVNTQPDFLYNIGMDLFKD
ncbi:hypothetical protein [Francisella sp. SYW-9]|uniref:hypothetical protein n=1 Tax=Francisella sp. SYW-9 TaxID=2610888 RepID=UPI00123D9DCD|nr:hypothetical protein [Francisella sp. SYW-9]